MAIFLIILFHSLIVAKMHRYKNIFMQKYIRIDTIHEFTFSFLFLDFKIKIPDFCT